MHKISNSYLINDTQIGVIAKSAPLFVSGMSNTKSLTLEPGTYKIEWDSNKKQILIDGVEKDIHTPIFYIVLCGGGGGGGGSMRVVAGTNRGGGGGGGGGVIGGMVDFTQTPYTSATITIGSGGAGGAGAVSSSSTGASSGGVGGDSQFNMFGKVFKAFGGDGGGGASKNSGGSGGNGGSSATIQGGGGMWQLFNTTGGNGGKGAAYGSVGGSSEDCSRATAQFSPYYSRTYGGDGVSPSNDYGGGAGGASYSMGASNTTQVSILIGSGGSGTGGKGTDGNKSGGAGSNGVGYLYWTN